MTKNIEMQAKISTLEDAYKYIEELTVEKTHLIDKIRSLMVRLEQSERTTNNTNSKLLYDEITGLPNHIKMDKDVGSLLWDFFKLSEPPKISLILVRLDNNFNSIRQAFNEDVFNNILYTIAARLKDMIGTRGLLYHPRLDEFAIFIFDNIPDEELREFTEEVRSNIEAIIDNQIYMVKIGCWMGVASFPDDGMNKRILLSNADIALNNAMDSNTRIVFFEEEMREHIIGNLEMQNSLLSAIEVKNILELNENFALFFQPIVTVSEIQDDGVVCRDIKAEVLIRWKDPNRGAVLPRNLIEVAEETGLILPIGKWLLNAAMLKLAEWQKLYRDLKLSINISPRQFYSNNFAEELSELIVSTGIKPSDIFLEITENCLFSDQDFASSEIDKLKEMGFKISLDDFGTGYSSLGYLNKFNADVLKIDKVFTEGLEGEGKKRNIIKSIVSIGAELGMDVIFEGIEDITQLREAYELGCRNIQGYLFSKPLTVDKFPEFLEKNSGNFMSFSD